VPGKRVVIVGGGGTGDATAFALRKRSFDGDIVILSADVDRPYDRPYLSKEFLRGEVEAPKVFLHEESDYAKERIDLRLEQKVTGGSLSSRRLTTAAGEEVEFDILVLGLGGTPRQLPEMPAANNVFTLRSFRDSQAIRQALAGSKRILAIGAGFIGAEVAASARQLGKEVLLVESAPFPLHRVFGQEVGEIYAEIHRSRGVDMRTGTTVQKWHTYNNRVVGVTLSDGEREDIDLVLVAVGIEPNLDLATALGLSVNEKGVQVDEHDHPVLGRSIRVEHWEVAKWHGRGIAAAIVAGDAPFARLPYFWSDQYDVSLEYRGNASGDDEAVWRGTAKACIFPSSICVRA
jgi:3-phenylpropionate/trans-cinnamate dioxygenase ferredoxin reductase subunit